MGFFVSDTMFTSSAGATWLEALRGQLADGGGGAPREVLGPVTALRELYLTCETMLAGRGGPNEDDRKSLVADVKAMRTGLGPATAAAIGPTLNPFIHDLGASRLATPQGARSIHLALTPLIERMRSAEVSQAAWDDVVESFTDDACSGELCEQRILYLRELCEDRGHAWFSLGLAHRLTRLISDSVSEAVALGAVEEGSVQDWGAPAGLPEAQRIELCRELVAEEARRGDVAVWLLFRNAYVDFWKRVGPVEFFHAHLMPDGIRAGGNLEGIAGYQPPSELADWGSASVYFEDLDLAADEHAVLARVWLADTLVEQAPERARELVQALVEVAHDDSQWALQEGEVAYQEGGGWFGSMGFSPPVSPDEYLAVHPAHERTGAALERLDHGFAERLAADEPGAAEAVEDARWVIAVSRAPTAAQRVALATRALERTLGIAQSRDEGWPDVTARYLRAPWLRLERSRWVQAAAVNARLGVAKTHGRGSTIYGLADELVYPRAEPGVSYPSAEGVSGMEQHLGPLKDTIKEGLVEHRLTRSATETLSKPKAALRWLREAERRFDVLLARTERCRNAVIHGQRPTLGTLATVDLFVRDLGRLVARESVRCAETSETPLAQLEQWRNELIEQHARLEAGEPPLEVLFVE